MPYTFKYDVVSGKEAVAFESGALLSADKMMVLYRGVANPISGSILGADNSQTTLSAPGASVSKTGGGKWNVTPGSGSTIALTISGKPTHGKPISQKFDFRIKTYHLHKDRLEVENELEHAIKPHCKSDYFCCNSWRFDLFTFYGLQFQN